MHLGYKWNYENNSQAAITRYTCHPLITTSEILDKIKDEIDGQTRMILEITTSGMDCTGPASSTVTFGFNFLPEN